MALLDHHKELPQMKIMNKHPKSPMYAGIGCRNHNGVLALYLGDVRARISDERPPWKYSEFILSLQHPVLVVGFRVVMVSYQEKYRIYAKH